jgi:hypothetical protein
MAMSCEENLNQREKNDIFISAFLSGAAGAGRAELLFDAAPHAVNRDDRPNCPRTAV